MNLQEALDTLGNSTEDIVLTLQFLQLKGRMRDPLTSPVSRYLHLCGIRKPSVSMSNIMYGDRQILPTPDAVSEFVRLFDAGKYPQLVRY